MLVGMRRGSGADEGKGEGRADGAGNGGMGSTASSRIHSSTTPDPPPQWRRDGAWVEAPAEWGAGGRVGEGAMWEDQRGSEKIYIWVSAYIWHI